MALNDTTKINKKLISFIVGISILVAITAFSLTSRGHELFSAKDVNAEVTTYIPLSYENYSHAINERNELILLRKTPNGYQVVLILSDSLSAGLAHTYYGQKYREVFDEKH